MHGSSTWSSSETSQCKRVALSTRPPPRQEGEMKPIATITPMALARLKLDLDSDDGQGKAVRIVFEGFG